MPAPKKIAIIGGGISGLATAYRFAQDPLFEVHLFEAQAHLGGKIRTMAQDGFMFEWGPTGFLNNAPETLAFIDDIGLSDQLIEPATTSNKRYLAKGEKLYPVPFHPFALIQTPLIKASSKFRLLKELFFTVPDTSTEQSVYGFMAEHFGEDITETFVDAMISGIHGGDIKKLSMNSCFPKMIEIEKEHASLIRGMVKNKKKGKTKLLSFAKGMQALIDQTEKKLMEANVVIHMETNVEKIVLDDETNAFVLHYQNAVHSFDQVISTIPTHQLQDVLSEFPDLRSPIQDITYAPMTVLGLGFNSKINIPEGFGFLCPRKEHIRLLGCIFESNVYPTRAPQGATLLRVMVGGAHDPMVAQESNDAILEEVMQELKMFFPDIHEPSSVQVFQHKQAIPQYNMGHSDRVHAFRKLEAQYPGIYFSGNAFLGISTNDCIRESVALYNRVIKSMS